jgi:Uma2 family endonuclease
MSSAATRITERLYTAGELLAMPSDVRFELVEGKLVPMPPTSDEHGWTTSDLGGEIWVFVRANDLGRTWAAETGFVLARDPDTVLAPDFSFIAKGRLNYRRTGQGYVPIAPDLVVETRSPSDRLTAMRDKIALWLSFGVRMALLLDPIKRTLTVYTPGAEPATLTPDDTLDGGDVLPGFALPLRRLFAE